MNKKVKICITFNALLIKGYRECENVYQSVQMCTLSPGPGYIEIPRCFQRGIFVLYPY